MLDDALGLIKLLKIPMGTAVILAALGGAQWFVYADGANKDTEQSTAITNNTKAIGIISSKLDSLAEDTHALKANQLRGQITDARRGQCKAANSEARIYYQNQLDILVSEYQHLMGYTYTLPGCEVFQ